MSEFRVFETEQYLSDLQTRLGPRRDRIILRLHSDVYPQLLAQHCYGRNIKKLKGLQPETWRYRIGAYRFFYEIDDERGIIFMIASDVRQDSY